MFLDNKFLSKSKIFHLYMLTSERFFLYLIHRENMLFQKKIICIMVWYEALVYISTHILVTLMKVEIVSDAALKLG